MEEEISALEGIEEMIKYYESQPSHLMILQVNHYDLLSILYLIKKSLQKPLQ